MKTKNASKKNVEPELTVAIESVLSKINNAATKASAKKIKSLVKQLNKKFTKELKRAEKKAQNVSKKKKSAPQAPVKKAVAGKRGK